MFRIATSVSDIGSNQPTRYASNESQPNDDESNVENDPTIDTKLVELKELEGERLRCTTRINPNSSTKEACDQVDDVYDFDERDNVRTIGKMILLE